MRIPKLKGSVGEGPNQTNYSDQSSIRIPAKIRNFRYKIEQIRKNYEKFNNFQNIGEILWTGDPCEGRGARATYYCTTCYYYMLQSSKNAVSR